MMTFFNWKLAKSKLISISLKARILLPKFEGREYLIKIEKTETEA